MVVVRSYVFNSETPASLKIRSLRLSTPEEERQKIDSEFEGEIIDHLASRSIKMHAQVNFEGYKLDVVAHDGQRHLVIECDGDGYHQDYEADRQRQSFLENHGFVFYRIWASDFYRNRGKTLSLLDDALKWAGILS